MANNKAKRCEYCGGTMWLDGDIVKCFMCSRPAKNASVDDGAPARWSQPKLPGSQGRHVPRRDK